VARSSKVSVRSNASRPIIVPLGPPTSTAAASLAPGGLQQLPHTQAVGVFVDPGRAQSPQTLKSFVPWLPSVPMAKNHSAPRSRMRAAWQKVSTLFTMVG
jgi:hypothetical protein